MWVGLGRGPAGTTRHRVGERRLKGVMVWKQRMWTNLRNWWVGIVILAVRTAGTGHHLIAEVEMMVCIAL